ncbi:aminotransferase class V-fold PLP-dependent enzyme [Kribbella sp. CA-293567]|uniref:aminotransferase class V-fold PLP-dependent enzyme n=1 Tax=Kribbella sp. CA-293567 TaxID=3002436 RepID=UPI0022DD5E02|nr:aminotransferase class V-fold PLP-dependent enzyme [Kribbella sp. CA-293567]WBQ02487.1 aminotransferase class V-fold PLP-dependent enzyme [Kribbella sp. CA-293567]
MSILSILEPANAAVTTRPTVASLSTGSIPATVGSDLLVPLADGRVTDYANFDHGASAPCLESVRAAVEAALPSYASVHRGNGYASRITTQWYERARAELHSFVGARDDDQVIFTRQTTDALNLLARAVPADATVIVFESEHHAALLPWPAERTVRLATPASQTAAVTEVANALRTAPEGPRLVVLTGASNVTGEIFPIAEIAAVAKAHGARVCLDAAQLAPHREVDIQQLDVDWVALSGHKLYAPYGAGALIGRADWLNAADPYLLGGGATASVTGDTTVWNEGPARHEGGSPNVIGAIALAAACAAIAEHREAIEQHERSLLARLRTGLAQIAGVNTYDIFGADADRVGTVCFTVDGVSSTLVSAALSAEYGIGVRDGKFCAHPLVGHLLAGSPETTAVRASLGLGTTREHVDRLVGAVRSLAANGPAAEYEESGHGCQPIGDPRDLVAPKIW